LPPRSRWATTLSRAERVPPDGTLLRTYSRRVTGGLPGDGEAGSAPGSAAPPVWNEVMPDLTVREPPAWYPDPATLSPDSEIIRPSILKDRAAWVGLDRALYYRTAETGKLRRFRPHGRRRVRGCAFAPDGQTLWAFDSACVFRVDVDD